MVRSLAPSLALVLVAACAGSSPVRSATADAHRFAPLERETARARVVLLRAWRLDPVTAAARGAPSGVGFEFLVVAKDGATGQFTLSELRDARLDGSSYAATSARRFEPSSVIEDPRNVRLADGRTVSEAYGLSGRNAVVMRTLLYGAPPPPQGTLEVIPDVGWGESEKVGFSLPLASLREGPARL